MAKTKKILLWALGLAVLGAVFYFLFLSKSGNAGKAESGTADSRSAGLASGPSAPQEVQPLAVRAVPAARGEVVISLRSPGEAYTERKVTVKAEVAGTMQSLNVVEGGHVGRGDLLAALDDRELRLRLHKLEALRLKAMSEVLLEKMFAAPDKGPDPAALARLDKARAAFEQADGLYREGRLGAAEWESARREYELTLIETGGKKEEIMASSKNLTQTEADVRIAELDLERASIRAPFPGVVTEIKVSPGERVAVGQELFTLVDLSRLKVKAKVLESEVGKIKPGREVSVTFPAYPGRSFRGVVEAVSPLINAEDKTCAVHIAVANPGEEIKPGMHAEVEIAAEVHKDRLIVPQEAILVRGGRKLVFVVEGDLAKWRYVETGVENEKVVEILDGVKEGEQVIVEGHFTLAHDARVSVLKQ
jgi:RND family efflux transporter MFP subunit